MSNMSIRLDRSRFYSECHGERTPEDPHFKVHYWQAFKVGKKKVLLPFDSRGELVEDDGRTEPWQGIVEGRPVTFFPLYTQEMRDLVARLSEKLKGGKNGAASRDADEESEEEDAPVGPTPSDDVDYVNFVSWLRGEVKYEPHLLFKAARARYHKNYTDIRQLVEDLVIDEKLVPEEALSPRLARYLPQIQA